MGGLGLERQVVGKPGHPAGDVVPGSLELWTAIASLI